MRSRVDLQLGIRPSLVVATAIACGLAGCVALPTNNPSVGFSYADAKAELKHLEDTPVATPRPVVILAGYRSPLFQAESLASHLAKITGRPMDQILMVSYPDASSFETAVGRVLERVERKWPSEDPYETREVDVVAISMGGLVARLSALTEPERRAVLEAGSIDMQSQDLSSRLADAGRERRTPRTDSEKRLNIKRLYTFSSPHRGARLADVVAIDQASSQMKSGSPVLKALDRAMPLHPYELVCYAQQNDRIVGATRSAPEGMTPIWTGGTAIGSHFAVVHNPRLLADLGRRLTGRTPLLEPGPMPTRD